MDLASEQQKQRMPKLRIQPIRYIKKLDIIVRSFFKCHILIDFV